MNKFPSDEFKKSNLECFDALQQVAHTVLEKLNTCLVRKFGCNLNLSENHSLNDFTLHIKLYPKTGTTVPKGTVRVDPHSDFTTLSLLYQDEIGGLQAQDSKGNFFDIPPKPNTIVLNVGDILEKWTNCSLKSTIHRVVAKENMENRDRCSVILFCAPNWHVNICPPESLNPTKAIDFPSTRNSNTSNSILYAGSHILNRFSNNPYIKL